MPIGDRLPRALEIAIEAFGMTPQGNFEGANILHLPRPLGETAEDLGMTLAELNAAIQVIKGQLYRVRARADAACLGRQDSNILERHDAGEPGRGCAAVLKRDDYLAAAAQLCGRFLLDQMLDNSGRLHRTHKDGRRQAQRLSGRLRQFDRRAARTVYVDI